MRKSDEDITLMHSLTMPQSCVEKALQQPPAASRSMGRTAAGRNTSSPRSVKRAWKMMRTMVLEALGRRNQRSNTHKIWSRQCVEANGRSSNGEQRRERLHRRGDSSRNSDDMKPPWKQVGYEFGRGV